MINWSSYCFVWSLTNFPVRGWLVSCKSQKLWLISSMFKKAQCSQWRLSVNGDTSQHLRNNYYMQTTVNEPHRWCFAFINHMDASRVMPTTVHSFEAHYTQSFFWDLSTCACGARTKTTWDCLIKIMQFWTWRKALWTGKRCGSISNKSSTTKRTQHLAENSSETKTEGSI